MEKSWNIVYYKSLQQGTFPVYDFINTLNAKSKGKVIEVMDLLETYGINLRLPHCKKLAGTKLWELRILGQDNIRIFYVGIGNMTFLLLHAFKKKKQKTDSREIKVALSRWEEYISR